MKFITDFKNNEIIIFDAEGRPIRLTPEDCWKLSNAADIFPFSKDIVNYVKESIEYDDSLLSDDEVMNTLIESYTDYRHDNDGGEEGYGMDWIDCIVAAFDDNEWDVAKYKKTAILAKVFFETGTTYKRSELDNFSDEMYEEYQDYISQEKDVFLSDFFGED